MPEARTRLVALLLGRYYFRPRVVWLCCCCALAQAVLRFYPVSVPLQSRKGSLICVVRPILMRLVFAGYLLPGAKRKYACALLARPPRLMGRGSSTTQPMPGSVCFAPEAATKFSAISCGSPQVVSPDCNNESMASVRQVRAGAYALPIGTRVGS